MLNKGDKYSETVTFTQEMVNLFIQTTKDYNPIHVDLEAAKAAGYPAPIVHGMLAASMFGPVFGTKFPGPGTINVSRSFQFLRPIFIGCEYTMLFTLVEIDSEKHVGNIKIEMLDSNNRVCISGLTVVMNELVFTPENYPSSEVLKTSIESVKLPEPAHTDKMPLDDVLSKRRSIRYFLKDDITDQQLSDLLWAANGVSKVTENSDGKNSYLFTNPSASNHQEVELYVFRGDGVFKYNNIIQVSQVP